MKGLYAGSISIATVILLGRYTTVGVKRERGVILLDSGGGTKLVTNDF